MRAGRSALHQHWWAHGSSLAFIHLWNVAQTNQERWHASLIHLCINNDAVCVDTCVAPQIECALRTVFRVLSITAFDRLLYLKTRFIFPLVDLADVVSFGAFVLRFH